MVIEFNPEKCKALKREYSKAVKDKKESFIFEGNEYVTSYAKYLLEFLKTKFKF